MQFTSIIKDVSWAIVPFIVPGYLFRKDSKGTTVDIKYFQFARSFLYIFSARKCTQILTWYVQGGVDKSLARPTSQCCRTKSIMLLERGICSCPEMQVFSCYRGRKEACQATRAISTTWRRDPSSSFLSCKARRRRTFTPF